jgi:hypothetical protein
LTAVTRPAMLDSWTGDVAALLNLFDRTRPLAFESISPGRANVKVEADGPGWVIVSQLADPEWTAAWDLGSKENPGEVVEILPTFRRRPSDGGWQRIRVYGTTERTLELTYRGNDVLAGLWISAVAWLAWGIGLVVLWGRERRRLQA